MTLLSTLKLNALTLDEFYNSREIVLTNIFHAALLQAFRFHSIVKNTFDRKNLNQEFLAQIVYESAGRIGHTVLRITTEYCKGNLAKKILFFTLRFKLKLVPTSLISPFPRRLQNTLNLC
jgi:hypothetical protein